MNIILFAFIYLLIVYLIYKNNNCIEKITNTQKKNSLDNNTSLLSYIPDETACNNKLTTIPKELIYYNTMFNLIGSAINKFYNQNYYLYESKNDQNGILLITENLDYLNEQLYSYLFVIFLDNMQPIIHQEFGPRHKIDIGDIIYIDIKYLSNRLSYIGPYKIL